MESLLARWQAKERSEAGWQKARELEILRVCLLHDYVCILIVYFMCLARRPRLNRRDGETERRNGPETLLLFGVLSLLLSLLSLLVLSLCV